MAAARTPIAGSASTPTPSVPDSTRNSAGPSSQPGRHEEQLGARRPRHERLGAAEHVAVAVLAGRGLERERVEQRPRLQQRHRRGGHVVADERRQVGGLLVGVAPKARARCSRRSGRGIAAARPMSPCASASAISTPVTAERSLAAPPSSSGTPSAAEPQLRALREQLVAAPAHAASASVAAGRSSPGRELAHGLAHHLLLVVRGEVEEVAARGAGRAGGAPELGRRAERAAGGGRAAEAVAAGAVDRALGGGRRPRRSIRSLPARPRSARRPRPMPLSATLMTPCPPGAACPSRRRAPRSGVASPLEGHRRGQQDRPAELDLDRERVRRLRLQGGDAARLRPHPVGDRAREPEGLRGEIGHVDRVAIARHAGVAAAEVALQLPVGGGAAVRGRRGGACCRPLRSRRRGAASCSGPPTPAHRHARLGDDREAPGRAGAARRASDMRAASSRSPASIGRQLLDRVGDVHEADRAGTGTARRSSAPCAGRRRARAGRWRAARRAAGSRRLRRTRRGVRGRPRRPPSHARARASRRRRPPRTAGARRAGRAARPRGRR